MKTYYIFVTIPLLLTFLLFAVPQFTGKAFVNNDEERKPKDWLSALLLKNDIPIIKTKYNIPQNIKHIVFQYRSKPNYGINNIYILESQSNFIEYNNKYSDSKFTITGDTLNVSDVDVGFHLYLDSNRYSIVFKNLNHNEVHLNQTSPLKLSFTEKSNVILIANRNVSLDTIIVSDKSNIKLTNCFQTKLNMKITNSMVNLTLLNNIDSLKANLIEKSNIKLLQQFNSYNTEDFNIIKKELNIDKTNIRLYPKGNMKFFNKNANRQPKFDLMNSLNSK